MINDNQPTECDREWAAVNERSKEREEDGDMRQLLTMRP